VQYSKDSPNAFFRKIPPAKIRKGGGAAPLTISSFSLAAKIQNLGKIPMIIFLLSNIDIERTKTYPMNKFINLKPFLPTIAQYSFVIVILFELWEKSRVKIRKWYQIVKWVTIKSIFKVNQIKFSAFRYQYIIQMNIIMNQTWPERTFWKFARLSNPAIQKLFTFGFGNLLILYQIIYSSAQSRFQKTKPVLFGKLFWGSKVANFENFNTMKFFQNHA